MDLKFFTPFIALLALSINSLAAENIPERNRRPYDGVDWNSAIQINTTSHVHCTNDKTLDILRAHNFEFFTISNYYPSAPTYPAGEMKAGKRCFPVTNHPVSINGVTTEGPFDWNEIIKPWLDSLPKSFRDRYPFKESKEKMFKTWKEGTLEAPNAEHHSFLFDHWSYAELHMCCPGSFYASGTFDVRDSLGTNKYGGYQVGSRVHWKKAVDNMLAQLQYPEGGGVTINHPKWSNLSRTLMLEILDYDPRVLGVEVLEAGENAEMYWDWVLASGRQCFGFFVPDHSVEKEIMGVNVLLVPERTAKACLEAYRKGNFYGAAHGLGELKFTSITFEDNVLKASTDKPAKFEVITAAGVVYTCEGTSMEYIPEDWNLGGVGPQYHVFMRIRATAADGCGEVLYSQPYMLSHPYTFHSKYPYI